MAKSIERACRRYRESLGRRCPVRVGGGKMEQVERFRRGMERTRRADAQVRRVVLRVEQTPGRSTCYANFGRRVAGLCRRYGAKTLLMQTNVEVSRWAAMGLRREVLVAVCREVFDLALE